MIAIPNMEKPKSCWKCRLMDGEANCLVTDEGISYKQEGIHPDCPLIEIDLVRCGECKWWDYETSGCTEIHPLAPFREWDFCSYGERRADE